MRNTNLPYVFIVIALIYQMTEFGISQALDCANLSNDGTVRLSFPLKGRSVLLFSFW